jgi:hypothetical protein
MNRQRGKELNLLSLIEQVVGERDQLDPEILAHISNAFAHVDQVNDNEQEADQNEDQTSFLYLYNRLLISVNFSSDNQRWAKLLVNYLKGPYLEKVSFQDSGTTVADMHPRNFSFYTKGPTQILLNNRGEREYALVGEVGPNYLIYACNDDCLIDISSRKARLMGFKINNRPARIIGVFNNHKAINQEKSTVVYQARPERKTAADRRWDAACVGKPEPLKRRSINPKKTAKIASGKSKSNFRFRSMSRNKKESGDRVPTKRYS